MTHVLIDHGHATDVHARPLTHTDACLITGVLHRAGIPMLVSVDAHGCVQLWPERALTTVEEVQALKAVLAVTDSGFAPHEGWPV